MYSVGSVCCFDYTSGIFNRSRYLGVDQMSIADYIIFGVAIALILGMSIYTEIHLTREVRRLRREINRQ